jgi:hypothetical protein
VTPEASPQPSATLPIAATQPVGVPEASAPASRGPPSQLIEIGALPTFVYLDQQSNFAPRNWSSSSPGAEIRVRTWISDEVGINAMFLTTLGSSLQDGLSSARLTPMTFTRFTTGLSYRGRYDSGGVVSQFIGRFEYIENQVRVPQTSEFRQRTNTTGFAVSGEADIGVDQGRSLRVEMTFAPRIKHEELDRDRLGASGTSPDTHLIGGAIGYRWRLSPTLAVDLRLHHSFERSLFGSTSSQPDPVQGQVVRGVGSAQSLSLVQIGFEWGN